MRKADRFYQIFIPLRVPEPMFFRSARLQGMSQTSTIIIAFIIYKYLRLIFQSSERSSMDDSIFVPLETRAKGMILRGIVVLLNLLNGSLGRDCNLFFSKSI